MAHLNTDDIWLNKVRDWWMCCAVIIHLVLKWLHYSHGGRKLICINISFSPPYTQTHTHAQTYPSTPNTSTYIFTAYPVNTTLLMWKICLCLLYIKHMYMNVQNVLLCWSLSFNLISRDDISIRPLRPLLDSQSEVVQIWNATEWMNLLTPLIISSMFYVKWTKLHQITVIHSV